MAAISIFVAEVGGNSASIDAGCVRADAGCPDLDRLALMGVMVPCFMPTLEHSTPRRGKVNRIPSCVPP
jgi:hypothetical protein